MVDGPGYSGWLGLDGDVMSYPQVIHNESKPPSKHRGTVGIDQEDRVSVNDSIPPIQNSAASLIPSNSRGFAQELRTYQILMYLESRKS